eukprot:TRINITY_DN6632_c1_g1_i1.p1 TRINITY_DN6632_c1_g1~~TRINITY_DN6632_c1_g1_i1.p1  ORF type:complete len:243 (+),score=87.08 TRINITY_DN6632_c1_g1_i1:52-729(+)
MLKNGMVSNNSNNEAGARVKDMIDYMKTDEYMKKREPKPEPEVKKPLYMKGPDEVGSRPEEVDLNDDDFELQEMRARRLALLKKKQEKAQELKKQGHGIYRDITEKDFLPEVTATQFSIVHFYKEGFARCALMHEKLGEVSSRIVQAKFMKMNAEEAPFFTDKLGITVLPCLVFFKDGVVVGRLQGFEGLSYGENFPAVRLEQRICQVFKLDLSSDALDELSNLE